MDIETKLVIAKNVMGEGFVAIGTFLKIGNADFCGILTKAYQKLDDNPK